MMKILLIDTAESKVTTVGLKIDGKKYFLKEKTGEIKSQNLLPLVEKILKKYQVSSENLTGIIVNTGPGSFTGLRVGVSVANVLGWVLGIPVNGKKQIVEPVYH